ncbi:MAG: hypothetical protein ACI8X3_001438 [Saprospiraceae bacterium]
MIRKNYQPLKHNIEVSKTPDILQVGFQQIRN